MRGRARRGRPVGLIRRRGVLGMLALGVMAGTASAAEVDRGSMSSPALRKGVNLTHWFEYDRDQGPSAADLQSLRRAGFDHVRLPFDPVVLGWKAESGAASMAVPDLQRAIDAVLAAGLDVVVDLHLTGETKQAIEDTASRASALIALWASLASVLAGTPADRVAVELFNEPQYYGLASRRWPPLQRRLLDAVRTALPSHLVLLSGGRGASVEGLEALRPVDDARVCYVFHFYLPYLFTHQGAEWLDPRWTTAGLYGDIRYPASQQAGRAPRLRRAHPAAAGELARYLHDDWRRERIAAALQPAFDWARRHRARVLCNEFGVIRSGVDSPSRYRWLADVRGVLEAAGIGWTVWDYTDIFGITAESARQGVVGERRIEPLALQALGLAA